jgi:hypothetical protein
VPLCSQVGPSSGVFVGGGTAAAYSLAEGVGPAGVRLATTSPFAVGTAAAGYPSYTAPPLELPAAVVLPQYTGTITQFTHNVSALDHLCRPIQLIGRTSHGKATQTTHHVSTPEPPLPL